jgi:hypothetical protein
MTACAALIKESRMNFANVKQLHRKSGPEYHCEPDGPEDKLGRTGVGYSGKAHMLLKLQSAIALFTSGCLVSVAASPSSIGFVVTNGQAQVDGAVVHGNSTLFQGSMVQAGNITSDLMFPGGSNLLLQPDSAVKVYREYAVLQRGGVIQRGTHALVADGLKVSSLSPQGAVFINLQDKSHVKVAAQSGAAEVRNQAGELVARLEPGKALSFAIQVSQQNSTSTPLQQNSTPTVAGQASPAAGAQLTLHGILRKDHPGRYGHFLLTDLATNVTYELQGAGLDDLVGASVEVTGSTFDTAAAEGASKVISVSDIHQMPLSEIRGNAPTKNTPAAAPPTPSGETVPSNGAGPEAGANPEATAPPEATNASAPAPLPQHNDRTKIIVIVALAAGAVVGVALGLAGGKSSTVSPE